MQWTESFRDGKEGNPLEQSFEGQEKSVGLRRRMDIPQRKNGLDTGLCGKTQVWLEKMQEVLLGFMTQRVCWEQWWGKNADRNLVIFVASLLYAG